MITNERQYRITKAELARLQVSLDGIKDLPASTAEEKDLAELHHSALASQVEEFSQLVAEYETLLQPKAKVVEAETLAELPTALIKARLAQGINQKELAERMGVKEQQIQRWEADGYANISFANLKKVVEAVGVSVREEVFIPGPETTAANLVKRLKAMGVPPDLMFARLIPSEFADAFRQKGNTIAQGALFSVAARIGRIFNLRLRELLADDTAGLALRPLQAARFKTPANANTSLLNVYALYANYLALLTAQACDALPLKAVPTDWKKVREAILARTGHVDFQSVLHYVWDCGVAVLPLDDPGAFHGAVWRFAGRNVIVLKQRKHYPSYWLHDLLHEFRHAGEQPGEPEFVLLESAPISPDRRESPEEEEANGFAEDAAMGGRSDEIEDASVAAARGKMELLKAAVPRISERYNVDQGYLANYLAAVLQEHNQLDFWGAATNLQDSHFSPFEHAREVFFERAKLNRLNEQDREILLQGLKGGREAYA